MLKLTRQAPCCITVTAAGHRSASTVEILATLPPVPVKVIRITPPVQGGREGGRHRPAGDVLSCNVCTSPSPYACRAAQVDIKIGFGDGVEGQMRVSGKSALSGGMCECDPGLVGPGIRNLRSGDADHADEE